MTEFAIGGAMLGTLSALYFYPYFLLQVPLGGMLETFGGEPVRSLAHLAELAEAARLNPDVALLEFMLVTGELIVLDAPIVWQTEEDIFALHAIPSRCSFDLAQ